MKNRKHILLYHTPLADPVLSNELADSLSIFLKETNKMENTSFRNSAIANVKHTRHTEHTLPLKSISSRRIAIRAFLFPGIVDKQKEKQKGPYHEIRF